MATGGVFQEGLRVAGLVFAVVLSGISHARWEEQADELPAWAQRGRLIFLRNEGGIPKGDEALYARWQPVLHEHGARDASSAAVARCRELKVPLSLRTEAVMFFGDDRAVRKIKGGGAIYAYREHTWHWAYDWWARDPAFREAAQVGRDGKLVLAYSHNPTTNREMGNVLSPALLRMRREISEAILTPRKDTASTDNPLYPNLPYSEFDDCRFGAKGRPYDIYPIFGNLAMVWYDNPSMGADYSQPSREAWRKHFGDKFGVPLDDPAGHPCELVRREWARFWAEAYGRYYDAYYGFHQKSIAKTAAPETCRALNGKLHCAVGLNASSVSGGGGAGLLYLFAHHKVSDFPGMLVEYWTTGTHGKHAPLFKLSMAAMRGRPTGAAASSSRTDAEALACNAAIVAGGTPPRTKAYIAFGYDNRALLANAAQGNAIGVLYNTRTGIFTGTLTAQYDACEQFDRAGLPYDPLVEDDLSDANADWLQGYAAVLVPGGEFNGKEAAALKRYAERGGHLLVIGQTRVEPQPYVKLASAQDAPEVPKVPLASAFGRESFADARLEVGKGAVTIRERPVGADELRRILEPQLPRTWRVLDSRDGKVVANVLRQPRRGDARIVGLVNHTGQVQRDVKIALPQGLSFPAAAAVSPDGYAERLKVENQTITVPELYNYSAVVLGSEGDVSSALATVQPKLDELVRGREPLKEK
ncbi:MAG: hypothetical protein FJ291_06510 [Planctomycetes bacterium]|nr:hypothetical protein [Planctomycetota bacterium]